MRVLVAFVIILSLVIIPPIHAQDDAVPRFDPAPCMVDVPDNLREGEDIQCGYLTVPEVHSDPTGPTIRLAVAILPATTPSPASDPLFMAQGGPGGSTLDYFVPAMSGSLGDQIRERRDIVLLEQRGTYYSEPSLRCQEIIDMTIDMLDENLNARQVDERGGEALAACHTRLVDEGINLAAFNSLESASDIEDLRQVLGYGPINFYGASYGTALAQHLMRDYPNSVRSAILDAVAPLSVNFLPDVRSNSQRAFDALFAACAADSLCNQAYPDLETTFYDLAAAMDANPIRFTITDPDTGDEYEVVLNGDSFINLMFNFMYLTQLIPHLPQVIYNVRDGNYTVLAQLMPYLILQRTMSRGMYYSVMCSEDSDLLPQELAPSGVNPRLEAVFGDMDLVVSNCAAWNVPALDASVDDPVVSDIPTLELSGAFDPVTPPAYADLVAQSLTNAYVFTFPTVGHGAFDTACGSNILMQFLADPQTEPDASCLADMGLTFRLPATPYDDPAGMFSLAVPYGWTAAPREGLVRVILIDSATDSRIMIAVDENETDVMRAIQAFVRGIVENDTVEPAQVREFPVSSGTWTQAAYFFSDGILLVLGSRQNDQVVMMMVFATTDTLDDMVDALNEVLGTMEFNP